MLLWLLLFDGASVFRLLPPSPPPECDIYDVNNKCFGAQSSEKLYNHLATSMDHKNEMHVRFDKGQPCCVVFCDAIRHDDDDNGTRCISFHGSVDLELLQFYVKYLMC